MATATIDKGMIWAVRFIGAALILALAYIIMRAVITFTNPESVWEYPTLAPVSGQNQTSRGLQNFNFTTDPFNRDEAIAVQPIAEVGEDAPETTLNLKLTGRTTGPNGTAILRTPDNKEDTYGLGDEIVSGVFLQAVNTDFIVLDVDGQIQRLTFERGNDTGLIKKTEADDNTPKTTVTVKTPVGQGTTSIRSTAISGDASTLFQNVSLRRVMKDGHLIGYSVKANRPGVDLTPFGFSKGDIVTAIGGTDITLGRPDFFALFEQAEKNGGVDVTVLRNGQVKTIRLGTP